MAFIAKLALTLVAVSTAAGIYLVVLGGWLVDRSFTELREARLTFVLFSLRSTVEANLDLGFGLRDVQQIQDLIEREKAADPTIEAIDVSTPDGVSVFSTDRGAIGDAVPEAWRRAQIDQRTTSTWQAFDRGEAIFGTAIEGDFGQTVGQIAIEVAESSLASEEASGFWLTSARALVITPLVPLAALAGIVIAVVAGRPFGQNTDRPRALDASIAPIDDPELAAAAGRAADAAAARRAALDEVSGELARIDAEL
jgi:hypothetical protein